MPHSQRHSGHEPLRRRKLLLHRRELDRIAARLQTERLALVPLKLYFKGGKAKLELGLGKGQKAFDKRQDIAKRDANAAPWNIGDKFTAALSLTRVHGRVRSSLVASDPLMTALGRPPREQLLTTRDLTANTLQALELTNGDTLARVLQRGAEKCLAGDPHSGSRLVDQIFRKALGRPPTRDELALAGGLVGEPAREEGVEDLLWAVTMLPEFQLIY